jgi:rhodanese-related sulfurtransferase
MEKRTFKDTVYYEISRISKIFSNPNRLEIIDLIANGPKSVEDIAFETRISIANASQHLQLLKKERLAFAERKGNRIYYSITSEEVYGAAKSLRDLALHISPHLKMTLDEFRNASGFTMPYTLDSLLDRKDLVFLDVRPEDEYEAGHIPNALSIPIKELELKINDIPKDKLIVAYCRGMFCTYADEAVKILNQKGFNAIKLDQNILEYQNEHTM